MTIWDQVFDAVTTPLGYFAIALASSALICLGLGKQEEFTLEAVGNMAASVLVYVANFAAFTLFASDLRQMIQAGYDALHIPTIDPQFWAEVPVWLGMLVLIVVKDFVDYWNHRWMHASRLGWLAHMAHHSDTHVNAFSAFRIHILESLVMWTSYTLLLTWMQLPQMVPYVVMVMMLHNMYVHLNLDWGHGPLKYILASPKFHRWHHADVPQAYGKNLANVIPLYDVMFGTYYMPGPCRAPMGASSTGIGGTDALGIYLYPFREAWRGLRHRSGRAECAARHMGQALGPTASAGEGS